LEAGSLHTTKAKPAQIGDIGAGIGASKPQATELAPVLVLDLLELIEAAMDVLGGGGLLKKLGEKGKLYF
jgi:hypothetical protein